MKDALSRGARAIDFRLQPHFYLVQELYVENPDADAIGPYGAGEWGRERTTCTVPATPGAERYRSDAHYRAYLAAIHEAKVAAVHSLLESFDFRPYRRVIELGCGDMPQAHAILARHPGIDYLATDFDPEVIGRCGALPMLSGIGKAVLDVTTSSLDELAGRDLVTSWSLEFALDDTQFLRLLSACKRHGVPYLLGTHTAIGPIRYLANAFSVARHRERALRRESRLLGWLRSSGEIARLAGTAGLRLESRTFHVNHDVLFLVP